QEAHGPVHFVAQLGDRLAVAGIGAHRARDAGGSQVPYGFQRGEVGGQAGAAAFAVELDAGGGRHPRQDVVTGEDDAAATVDEEHRAGGVAGVGERLYGPAATLDYVAVGQ